MEDEMDWYGPDAATFGDRVAAARERSGMTQAALARRLGVRTATLRSWEDDISEPRANRLSILAGMLGVTMMWLITGEGDGIEAPAAEGTVPPDAAELLSEMNDLRLEMLRNADHLGRLEKRLRLSMRELEDV